MRDARDEALARRWRRWLGRARYLAEEAYSAPYRGAIAGRVAMRTTCSCCWSSLS